MQKSIFAIGLFGDRLEVALWRRGAPIALRRHCAQLDDKINADAWSHEVRGLGPILQHMTDDIARSAGIRVRQAFVVYASASAVGECASFPVRTAAQARSAASLALLDSMQSVTDGIVNRALLLEWDSDRPASGRSTVGVPRTSPKNSEGRRAHVVAAADCDASLEAIQALVESAGLQLEGAVPIQAATAVCGFARAAHGDAAAAENHDCSGGAQGSGSGPRAHLHLGEAGAFLLIRDVPREPDATGEIRFTRSIPIGTTSLAAALVQRALSQASDENEQQNEPSHEKGLAHRLDIEAAQCALYEFGLPDTPDAKHEPTGLTARDVLPLLQPLVQRLVVELRQSLRFALEATERSRVVLIVSGAGAAVPGLAAALGRELGIAVIPERRGASAPFHPSWSGFDLFEASCAWLSGASLSIKELGLQPNELVVRSFTSRIRRGLWSGAAAALLLIALDAGRLVLQLSHLEAEQTNAAVHPVDQIAGSSWIDEVTNRPQETIALVEAALQYRAAVERETSRSIDFRACLHELSRLTPGTVRLTRVSFQPTAEAGASAERRTGGTISGIVRSNEDGPVRAELERFIDALRRCPLFDEVALVNIQLDSETSRDQRFELQLSAFHVPVTAFIPVDSPSRESSPSGIASVPASLMGGEQ